MISLHLPFHGFRRPSMTVSPPAPGHAGHVRLRAHHRRSTNLRQRPKDIYSSAILPPPGLTARTPARKWGMAIAAVMRAATPNAEAFSLLTPTETLRAGETLGEGELLHDVGAGIHARPHSPARSPARRRPALSHARLHSPGLPSARASDPPAFESRMVIATYLTTAIPSEVVELMEIDRVSNTWPSSIGPLADTAAALSQQAPRFPHVPT